MLLTTATHNGFITTSIIVKPKRMNNFESYTVAARNNKVLITGNSYEAKQKRTKTIEHMRNLGKIPYSGEIKSAGKRVIENRFHCWFKANEYHNSLPENKRKRKQRRFVLITLTLPTVQMHDDKTLKLKALKPFIKELERKKGMVRWSWKAEAQKNGNLHFHVVTDTYIPRNDIDEAWFRAMERLGYLQKYQEEHPEELPPSCNVKGQHEMRNPVSYITKYFEKTDNRRNVKGALWRSSKTLLLLENFKIEIGSNEVDEMLQKLGDGLRKQFDGDFFTIAIAKKPIALSQLLDRYEIEEKEHWKLMYERLDGIFMPPPDIDPRELALREIEDAAGFDITEFDDDYFQLAIPEFEDFDLAHFVMR